MISNLKDLWHKLIAPRATDEDEAPREDIANVIAERERLLAIERAQARRQAALFRLSAELAATLDETEVCRRVVDGLQDTLDYDYVALLLVDETTGDRVLAAGGAAEPPTRIPPGQGLSERPLLDGQLHYTPDVTQDPRYIPGLGGAEVDVPIQIGRKVLGVLTAESRELHAFSQDDFEVLTAAAQQTGLAIEKARLLAAERQRADELDALRTTMADITAELELSALLQAIVERAAGLLDATGGELGLYDEANQEIRIVVSHNLDKDYVGTRLGLGEGAMGRVAETGEPLIIEDYQTWEGRAPQYADVHVHASLNAPLKVGSRLVGAISIATADPARQFGPANLHLLSLFAQQAAIAIENARLYEGARQRAEELGAINAIAQTVTSSLDLDKVIRSVMKGINRILRVETGSLLLIDEGTNELVFKITLQGDTEKLAPYRLKMGQGIAGWVAQRGEPLLVPDVRLDPRHYGAIDETIGFTSRSIMCVPLTVKNKVIGVIEVVNKLNGTSPDSEARFNENDLKLLSSMAAPVAIAIENARLYDQAQRDITERKKLEEEIRRQKDYFEALFVNSPVAVVTAGMDANVVSWNPMAEKLFGYTQEEAIGQNVDDLVANDPRIREEAVNYTKQVFMEGRVHATTKRTRKDGSLVDVEVSALPVIVAGEMVGYIAIYHDISELQLARRTAEAANQAKSAFLANMSHELRTPLNAILGFTQLMDRDPNLTAGQQENLGIINRSGEHLLALINDVLEMSKIEAGRVTLQETSFDLYRLLDGLEEMFGLRAKDKGLALSFERAENVPRYVRTDEGKLRQVLSNLLGNAVKFTQEGGVVLRVRYDPLPGPPPARGRESDSPLPDRERGWGRGSSPRLLFEVEDTGLGIAPEELAVVFDPFVQATRRQQSQEGTGLGLSISRQYVRLMGGDITVSSELGQGSLFQFDVQVGLADAAEIQAAQPRRRVLGLEPNQPIYRLLVAEDKETNRRLLVKLLEPLGPSTGSGQGFEVKEAVNGQEAIEIWERWEPHLIWMDMRMPVMDGYEATRRIKATTKGQATVIIALTATAFEEDRERVLSEGCDDFVRKPFREDEIFDKLAEHLGVRFVYEEQAPPATAQLAEAQDVLTPAALAALPAGWVADLQQATIKADLNLILTLIDQIQGENPALADALADLARNFEYKKILTVIEQAGG